MTKKSSETSASVTSDSIFLELEEGAVESPMAVWSDGLALGGEYVRVTGDNKSSSVPPSEGKVTLEVTLTGGEYTLWARTIAETESSDSFWVQINDGQTYLWNEVPITPFWRWSKVHDWENNNEPITWSLPAGTHQIKIYYREPGSKIDALFISNTDAVPTKGDDLYPPNIVDLIAPPVPWREEYNFTLPGFQFEHPMTVISQHELNMVKHYIDHQVEPQHTAFIKLIEEADEEQSFVPDAPATMNIMGGYEDGSNLEEVREQLWRNCHAAYSSGLAYALTGESKYADKAVEVMMDWANANTTFTGQDRGLQLGSWFSQVLYAADLIHEYEGWTTEDRATFKAWWRNNVLIHTLDVMRGKDNNWKDAALLGVFTAAVVLEDTVLLKESLIQLKSYFYERVDESVRNPGVDWKIRLDANGTYLPREVVRNDGRSGLTYTAYAMTTMVQCLDIAKYAGFDLWHDSTSQGGNIRELMETYFRWDILDATFPWNPNPNKSDKRRNAYELANLNLDLSPALVSWIEDNRPQVAREGDEYATLTKGDLHLTKLLSEIDLLDNQVYAPGDTIRFSIDLSDPSQVGLSGIEVQLNGETRSTHQEMNVDTYVVMPETDTPSHEIKIIITDGFGVKRIEEFTALNTNRAKKLDLDFESSFGTVAAEPSQDFYEPGQAVTLTAVARFPYYFKNWNGGNTSSEAQIEVTMDQDLSLEAVFEILEEPRANYNFQPAGIQAPNGYRLDGGRIFGLSESIQSGWRIDQPTFGIRRTSDDYWDPRKLTYIQMQIGTEEGMTWEMEVANGEYNVELSFGDPGNPNHVNTFYLEGQLVEDPDGKDSYDLYSFNNVEINDGFLTITPAGENVKINYIKVTPAETPLNHYVAIKDGTGGGEYPVGAEVNISTGPATGTDLFEWVGDSAFVDDVSSNETFLTMPDQDVQLKASYVPTYSLQVEGGTGSGNYREGADVAISAEIVPNRAFFEWSGDIQYLEDYTAPNTILTMANKEISVRAEYESVLGFAEFSAAFKLYPNPTQDEAKLDFSLSTPSELTIELIDLSGKLNNRISQKFPSGKHSITLKEGLVSGINVVRIYGNETIVTHLLVKQ